MLLLSTIFAIIGNTLLGSFVIFQDRKSILHLTFGGFSISVAFGMIGDIFFQISYLNVLPPLFWLTFAYSGAVFSPPLLIHFFSLFAGINLKKPFVVIIYAISFLLLICNWLNFQFFGDVSITPTSLNMTPGNMLNLLFIYIVVALLYSIIVGFYKLKTSKGLIRQRLLYNFIGLLFVFGSAFFYITSMSGVMQVRIDNLGMLFYSAVVAFAILKAELFSIQMVVSKVTSYLVSILIMAIAFSLISSTLEGSAFYVPALLLFCVLCAEYMPKVRDKIQTTAEFKWITGIYHPATVVSTISKRLSGQVNRQKIFETILNEVVGAIQISQHCLYVAVRDSDEQLQSYEVNVSNQNDILEADRSEDLVNFFTDPKSILFADRCNQSIQSKLTSYGFNDLSQTIVMPFYSPEYLEGIIILGKRSSEQEYTDNDIQFLEQVVSVVSAFLYRLTPYEKIEQQYFETQKKLHESELMQVQSQKNLDLANIIQEYNHEIRTPLQAILTYAQYLPESQEEVNMDDINEAKKVIVQNAERAGDIIEATLRLSSGNIEEEMVHEQSIYSINVLMKESLGLIHPKESVVIKTNLDEGEYFSMIHREGMERVFLNLIKNADEAMPEGGTLSIKVNAVDEELCVTVQDTGIGISKDMLQKIWDPYQSRHVTKGRGLGLSIVHKIITEHNARITVDSEEGYGTTFKIYLKKVDN